MLCKDGLCRVFFEHFLGMSGSLFIVVADAHFFPGALAAVASIQAWQGGASVVVVESGIHGKKLSSAQRDAFGALGVQVDGAHVFERGGRKLGAWELKAYAAEHYAERSSLVVGMDADCTLCGPVDDVFSRCEETGGFIGGKDGDGAVYDKSYEPYGFQVPARNDAYLSTSLYFCKSTSLTRSILKEWADCCADSVFGSNGIFPGARRPGSPQCPLIQETFRGGGDPVGE